MGQQAVVIRVGCVTMVGHTSVYMGVCSWVCVTYALVVLLLLPILSYTPNLSHLKVLAMI